MKSNLKKYLLIGFILFSCNTSKNTAGPAGDGKSYETAVVIHESSDSKGIHAEYQWIHDHYSDYKVVRQSLTHYNKKPFDIITIQFADERKQDIYFDISNFFK